jgi:uncharacterized protein
MTAGPASRPLAIVTGASRGIGYELAVQFAKNGFDLIVAAEDDGVAAAARRLEEHGGQAAAVQADLATFDGVENLYLAVQSMACPIAALAINAGAGAGVGGDFVVGNLLADELRLVSLNVTTTVHLTKRVLADMIAHNGGKVLLASSAAAAGSVPYHATYAASNAFLRSFAEALSYELRDTPLTITAMIGQAYGNDDPAHIARLGFEALLAGRNHVAGFSPADDDDQVASPAGSPGVTSPVS